MKKLLSAAALAAFAISGHAALQGRDLDHNGFTDAFYDTDLNITWLKDANYANTSGFDLDGKMTWAVANTWAAGLTIAGYNGWRLPTTTPGSTCYKGCTDSEMGHLFYTELGNTATNGGHNFGNFSNVQVTEINGHGANAYWSTTPRDANNAFEFFMYSGAQGFQGKGTANYAMLVRVGDVPEPETYAMLLAGLGVMGAVARRRKAPQA